MKSQAGRCSTWMPLGVKVANLHLHKDGMYTDEVVAVLVDIDERSHKSWDVMQSCCRGLHLEVWRKTTSQLRVIEKINMDEGNNKTDLGG